MEQVAEMPVTIHAPQEVAAAPAWSPPLTLSETPVYYSEGSFCVRFAQDGQDGQDSDGQLIKVHVHEGIHHWNVWGVMYVWPRPCNPLQCGPYCNLCDRSPCDEGFILHWPGNTDERKAEWLARSPEVELPTACALFGCSGCPHVPIRCGRNMPRRYPWPPNQSPWFSESYSAQVRANLAKQKL